MTKIEQVAAAIANRRAGRRGAPAITNVLEVLKLISGGKLYDEVMDDAQAAIEAMREPTEAMIWTGDNHTNCGGSCGNRAGKVAWYSMIDAALKERTS